MVHTVVRSDAQTIRLRCSLTSVQAALSSSSLVQGCKCTCCWFGHCHSAIASTPPTPTPTQSTKNGMVNLLRPRSFPNLLNLDISSTVCSTSSSFSTCASSMCARFITHVVFSHRLASRGLDRPCRKRHRPTIRSAMR